MPNVPKSVLQIFYVLRLISSSLTLCKICKWFPINQMQGNTGNFLQKSVELKSVD